jgi:hypothetical protein
MKSIPVVTMGALLVLASLAACSSAPPPKPSEPGLGGAQRAEPGSGSPATSVEAFERECGSSSRLPRVLEKPLTSMGRKPRMAALLDDGFLIAGEREAKSVALTPTRAVVVMRLNSEGTVVWDVTLVHPAGRLSAKAVAETTDGGFAVLGSTELTREPRTYGWLAKLTADGKILWRMFFEKEIGADLEKGDKLEPRLQPYAFERMAVSDKGTFVLSGAAATAEIDIRSWLVGVKAEGAAEPPAEGSVALPPELGLDRVQASARLADGGTAVVTVMEAPELDRRCLRLLVLEPDGSLRAKEPLAAEPLPGDLASIAPVGAYKVAVAFADVGAMQILVLRTDR